jgi:hypothetical protein
MPRHDPTRLGFVDKNLANRTPNKPVNAQPRPVADNTGNVTGTRVSVPSKEEWNEMVHRICSEDLLKLQVPSLQELRAMHERGELKTKRKL